MSIERRLATITASGTVIVCLCAFVSALVVRSWAMALDERRQLRDLPIGLSTIRLAYSDQETGVRGYLLTGQEAYLRPYTEGRIAEARAAALLELRVRGLADLRTTFEQIQRDARRWQDDTAEPQIARRRTSASVDEVLVAKGRQQFDALRTRLDRFDALGKRRLANADDRSRELQRIVVGVLAGTFALILGGLGLATMLFRRWITRPLARIGDAARSIGRGEMSEMPNFVTVELSDVSSAVDFLHRSRVEERDRAVRAFKALEQSAVLAIQVRSELTNEHVQSPDGWTIASMLRSAEGIVAGDCFDLGLVDQRTGYVVVIDVTGHGAEAALTALKAKSQLRSALKAGVSPGVAMGRLAAHQEHDDSTEYLTAFVAVIDLPTGSCSYANAGHPPALIGGDLRAPVQLAATGPLIGPFRSSWATNVEEIRPGESLLVYTDGLTEVCGKDRIRLGEDRVIECLGTDDVTDAHELVQRLVEISTDHLVGSQTDDVTVVVLRRDATT